MLGIVYQPKYKGITIGYSVQQGKYALFFTRLDAGLNMRFDTLKEVHKYIDEHNIQSMKGI